METFSVTVVAVNGRRLFRRLMLLRNNKSLKHAAESENKTFLYVCNDWKRFWAQEHL